MTARQEAVVALREAFERPLPTDAPFEERLAGARYARALDAIPDDVLARYAIERGALVRVEIAAYDWDPFDAPGAGADRPRLPGDTVLYREADT